MNTDRTYRALADVRAALPYLADALVPGTRRRWAQRDLTVDQRRRMNVLAVVERDAKERNLAAGITALGTGRAPLQLDVLDATDSIRAGIAELEQAVADRLGITPLTGATTTARIGRLVDLLARVAMDDVLAEHAESEAVRLARLARWALGDTEAVHRIDARCPICDATSLRAFPERDYIMCVNTSCACPDPGCGCHRPRPGRHWWNATEWPWLAQVLRDDLREAS